MLTSFGEIDRGTTIIGSHPRSRWFDGAFQCDEERRVFSPGTPHEFPRHPGRAIKRMTCGESSPVSETGRFLTSATLCCVVGILVAGSRLGTPASCGKKQPSHSAGSRTETFAWAPLLYKVKIVRLVGTELMSTDCASVTMAAEIHPGSTPTYTARLDDIPNLIHKGVSAILLAQPRSQTWRAEYFAILRL